MFAVEILDAQDVRRVAAIIDTADTFEAALSRYAEIAWEDPTHVLLGRAVIIREGRTGDVRAVGSYRPGPKRNGPPDLVFLDMEDDDVWQFRQRTMPDGEIRAESTRRYVVDCLPD
jgi:hypothetical protein